MHPVPECPASCIRSRSSAVQVEGLLVRRRDGDHPKPEHDDAPNNPSGASRRLYFSVRSRLCIDWGALQFGSQREELVFEIRHANRSDHSDPGPPRKQYSWQDSVRSWRSPSRIARDFGCCVYSDFGKTIERRAQSARIDRAFTEATQGEPGTITDCQVSLMHQSRRPDFNSLHPHRNK